MEAMARRKHVLLVADTDTTVTVTGRGLICVTSHDPTANKPVFATVNTALGALLADDAFAVGPGRPRIIGHADGDSSTDVHLRGTAASQVSVELLSDGEEDQIL